MPHPQQMHLFSSFHLESLLRVLHVGARHAAKPRIATVNGFANDPKDRLRAAVSQLDLPALALASPYGVGSRSEIAHAASNIEAWMSYLPRSCVRKMVLDVWQWTT